MAKQFQRGETVIMTLVVRNENGAKRSPSVSTTVTVQDPDETDVVDAAAMDNDATGEYHKDYTIAADAVLGSYRIDYIATNGSPARVSIMQDAFEVVERMT